MNKKLDIRKVTIMAMLIALVVIFSQFLSITTPLLKVSFAFVPQMIMAMIFGPFWSVIGFVTADLIGNFLFPKGAFFIGFTLNAAIAGLIYGCFFYKKTITLKACILCTVTWTLVISLGFTPIWLAIISGLPLNSWAIWAPRLTKAIIFIPVQTMLMYSIGKALPHKNWLERLNK